MRLIEWITLKTLNLVLFIISSSFVDNGGVNKSKKTNANNAHYHYCCGNFVFTVHS